MGRGGLCARRRVRAGAWRGGARPARPAAGRAYPRCRLRRRHADAARSSSAAPTWSASTTVCSTWSARAKAKGLDARLMDAADMKFDAKRSTRPSPTPRCTGCSTRSGRRAAIWFALKIGGRFAGEMGGEGNIARPARRHLRRAADGARLSARRPRTRNGIRRPTSSPPSTRRRASAGRRRPPDRSRRRRLEHGVAAWVKTFRAGWLDRAGVPERRDESRRHRPPPRAELRRPDGSWFADYVRLRFIMRKPA